MTVFAVCVWFHPTREDASHALTYADQVGRVLVVDNSPGDNRSLLPAHPRIHYRPQFANTGIGRALNLAAREALAEGATWILTMDQDSSFAPDDIRRLLACAEEEGNEQIAIFAPTFEPTKIGPPRQDCDSAITSGSLIRLAAHHAIGGHNEDLFLDDVDHEFGYRLRRHGYRIVCVNEVFLAHRVGDPLARRFLWRTIHSTNHSAVRKYYMTRNRLYMRKHFPEFGAPYLKMVLLDAVKVLLVEQDKRRKLACMAHGALDFLRGTMGEWQVKQSSSVPYTRGGRHES